MGTPCRLLAMLPTSSFLLISPLQVGSPPRSSKSLEGLQMPEKALSELQKCLSHGLPVQNGAGHSPEIPLAPSRSCLNGAAQPPGHAEPMARAGLAGGVQVAPLKLQAAPHCLLGQASCRGKPLWLQHLRGLVLHRNYLKKNPRKTSPVPPRVRGSASFWLAKKAPSNRCWYPQSCHRGRPRCHRSSAVARQ